MNIKTDKDLIIFDLDGTLAESKSAISESMAKLVAELLTLKKVAVISGGAFPQFEAQFLDKLPECPLQNLFLMPTSGTKLYTWQGKWNEEYDERLSDDEKKIIIETLNDVLKLTNFQKPEKTYGITTEDRDSQITFSALGQQAPLELKEVWDPDSTKRVKIVDELRKRLPNFDVRIGGKTSIDITMKGVNKAYGIHKLEEFLHIPIKRMIFVGDTLFPGGNDYPAKTAGVDCIQVSGPSETEKTIKEIIK